MIHIHLVDATRNELQALRRTSLPAKVRDRLEAVLLSDAGWSPPRIARHLAWHPHTARALLRAFRQRGLPALWPAKPGPVPNLQRRQQVNDAVQRCLGQERTWTSRQLSEALQAENLPLSPRQLRRYLRHLKAGYRRTASTLEHKQDPAKVARAAQVLAGLKTKAQTGRLQLYYLDEVGFAPSLPVSYSWCLPGQRKRVKYEYPQGRRVNALATYAPFGLEPWLDAQTFERTLTSADLIAYLQERLPTAAVPRVVVLDNASLHVSKVTKTARSALAKMGIYLYYLPPYSPERNAIECLFKQIKHHEMPQRSHTSKQELRQSVERGFASYGDRLRRKGYKQLRPAA